MAPRCVSRQPPHSTPRLPQREAIPGWSQTSADPLATGGTGTYKRGRYWSIL